MTGFTVTLICDCVAAVSGHTVRGVSETLAVRCLLCLTSSSLFVQIKIHDAIRAHDKT